MANESIADVAITEFVDRFHVNAQQMMAHTMPYVDFKMMDGEDMAYDTFGVIRAQKAETRSPKITFSDTDFGRRKLAKEKYYAAVPIYEEDVNNMLADPKSPIITACLAELNRIKDRIVVTAATADVLTGRNFGTTVTFAGDNGLTVNATAGATYEKLLEGVMNFKQRDVRYERIGFFMSEQEEERFFQETELTSSDFIDKKPVPGGYMLSALGADFVVFGSSPVNNDPILSVSSSVRDCIMIAKTAQSSGVCMGISTDINVKVQERSDLLDTDQVLVTMSVGAVRTEGALVQKFQTTAS